MGNQSHIRWRLGALAGLAVVLVTLIPQISVWISRGDEWQGSYAFTDPDELAYSAYLSSLIAARPRRNNPYRGLEDSAGASESLFSVQFLPPYTLSLIARLLGISASTVFILLIPVLAFISSLAVFWLLAEVTGENRVAAAGVLIVLLFGQLVSESPLAAVKGYGTFAFLRRYIPALPFPLFILFCVFVWRAFSRRSKTALRWSVAAGVVFGVLVYSYFYLWTAAAAWLLCFSVLWVVVRRDDRLHVGKCVSVVGVIAAATLFPYFRMLQERATTVDPKVLVLTHTPDVFRFVEVIGAFMLLAIAWNIWRGNVSPKSGELLFAASCCAAPFVVFNQQIITGHSLQPFHYEQFVINYLLLVGVVITYRLIWWHVRIRQDLWIAIALMAGVATGFKSARANFRVNLARDEAVAGLARVEQIESRKTDQGIILFDRAWLAASVPTTTPIHVLWSPYSYTFGTSPTEEIERFYQYLYYKGTDGQSFQRALRDEPLYRGVVFGLHRENTKLSQDVQPISEDEIRIQAQKYMAYTASFSQQMADRWPLSHVVMADAKPHDFSNLDRWYVRDEGERIGEWMLYHVYRRSTP